MADREELRTSFGAAASTYEAGRPDYPVAAVEWMLAPARLGDHALRVADVGAGTGKLTRVVRDLGAQVVAIDPDAAMLRTLRENVVGVPTYRGTAEAVPLPDAGMDAVVFGQAWHWVKIEAACAEAGRVLRPGGVLALVWNIRDDREDWVARLTAVMHGSHAEEMLAGDGPAVAPPFAGLEAATWAWSRPMTRDDLFALARSRSYVLRAEPAERARIERDLASLCDDIGAVAGAVVPLPYVTHAFRSIRP
ncbi:class I SAM-dependent methyltransferase [Microbacterium sp. RD1]|uniref:class I SAM-dependent methyltransferase n=1 Tax=Microbacterium sp. RD1 TaxID=3457313 RepID=UPI003FA5F0AF